MHENNVISARLSNELIDWLNNKAISQNCKTSDLVRNAVIAYKAQADATEAAQFASSLDLQAAKTTIMTYRLLENFVVTTQGCKGIEMRDKARQVAVEDVEKHKINTQANETT